MPRHLAGGEHSTTDGIIDIPGYRDVNSDGEASNNDQDKDNLHDEYSYTRDYTESGNIDIEGIVYFHKCHRLLTRLYVFISVIRNIFTYYVVIRVHHMNVSYYFLVTCIYIMLTILLQSQLVTLRQIRH